MGLAHRNRTRCLRRWGASAGVAVLLVAAALAMMHRWASAEQDHPGSCLHSDALYVAALCRTLLGGSGAVAGTHLPGAPYLSPDAALALPCVWLLPNATLAYSLYALLFYSLLAAVLTWLGREAGLSGHAAFLAGASGVVLFLATELSPGAFGVPGYLNYPGDHVGVILIGLLLAAVTLRSLRRGLGLWDGAGVVVGALTAFSDKLLIVQFLVPLGLVLLLLACCRLLGVRRLLLHGLPLVLTVLLSFGCKRLFERLGFVLLPVEQQFRLAQVLESCRLCLQELPAFLAGQAQLDILVTASLVSALLVLWRWRSAGRAADNQALLGLQEAPGAGNRAAALALAALPLLVCLCNLGAVLGTAMWRVNGGNTRYLMALFFVPLLLLPLLLRLLPWRHAAVTAALPPALVAAFALWQLGALAPGFSWRHFRQPYPDIARALDQLARERGAAYGLAGFWSARSVQYATHSGVRIKAVADGAPFVHADNPNDFLSADPKDLTLPTYRFVLLQQPGDPNGPPGAPDWDSIRQEFGEPQEKQHIDGLEVWLYDHLSGLRFDRFLKGVLAGKVRRQWPFEGPAHPASLGRPRDNYTPWDARGNHILATGQPLELRFAHPLTGAMIDLGADADSAFELTFARDRQTLATVEVPAVPWTGAAGGAAEYETGGQPSIFARLVPLPAVLRTQPWDRVTLRPLPSFRPRHSVAHLLLYHEALEQLQRRPPRQGRCRYEAEKQFTRLDPEASRVADPSASGGEARRTPAQAGVVTYGPYISLGPGRYRVEYAVQVEGPVPPEQKVARLLVTASQGSLILADQQLRGRQCGGEGAYQVVPVVFEARAEQDYVEFRLDSSGAAALRLDYIDLIPLDATAVSLSGQTTESARTPRDVTENTGK